MDAPGTTGSEGAAQPAGPDAAPASIPSLLAPLRDLDLDTVAINIVIARDLDLRDPLNVVIRGLLGARLRDLRCLTRAPTCDRCDLTARCDYIRIFETPAALTPGAHGSHGPHPFWLQGIPAEHHLPAGTMIAARLATIGFARPLLPYLDVALRDAWMRLGAGAVELSASRTTRERLPPHPPSARALSLHALTPLVLSGDPARAKEGCPAAPWLSLLVRAGVRRLRSLDAAYAGGPERVRVAFPDLREVVVVDGGWSRWGASRYSARQKQRQPLGGWIGRATVRGEGVAEIAPLLSALGVLSVGKGTTMGFGEVRVEEAADHGR